MPQKQQKRSAALSYVYRHEYNNFKLYELNTYQVKQELRQVRKDGMDALKKVEKEVSKDEAHRSSKEVNPLYFLFILVLELISFPRFFLLLIRDCRLMC